MQRNSSNVHIWHFNIANLLKLIVVQQQPKYVASQSLTVQTPWVRQSLNKKIIADKRCQPTLNPLRLLGQHFLLDHG